MTCHNEVHVGDIGTLYKVRVLDSGVDFDPSTAVITQLIFQLPGGRVETKDATIQTDASPATQWFLTYQVEDESPAFHAEVGKIKVQGYLEWADGSKFHSDVQTTDVDGVELRIYPNLG